MSATHEVAMPREFYAVIRFAHPWESESRIISTKNITHIAGEKQPDGRRPLAPFQPRSITDFDRNQLYRCRVTEGSKDGLEHPYYCYIGRMAESKEALKDDGKRITWLARAGFPSDAESSTAEEKPVVGAAAVLAQKAKTLKTQQMKRDNQNNELMQFQKKAHFDLRKPERIPLAEKTPDNTVFDEIKMLRGLLQQTKEEQTQEIQNQFKLMMKEMASAISAQVSGAISAQVSGEVSAQMSEMSAKLSAQMERQFNSLCQYNACDTSYVLEWVNSLPNFA